jgi:glycosyltransferase involved in cell wall biosynthesis
VSSLRRALIVNTSDAGGGAEVTSMALLDGFEALGTETRMAVGSKRTDDPRVIPLHASPHVDYTPEHPLRRARRRLRRRLDRRVGLEDFNYPYTRHLADLSGERPDVVLCNNLHGGFFDLRQLPWISLKMPVVLRLADRWSFTGHCAVPGTCERWRTGCGRCPDLAAPPRIERDATRVNWQRKRWILARSRVFVATPSRWTLERARESILAPAISEARVIPDGIDLATFSPDGDQAQPPADGTRRLVFAANGGASNPHKDFATLRETVRRLDGPVELISVGGDSGMEDLGDGIRIRHERYLPPARLAALYRSADAYVHASAEENFGLTTAEALACGTPAIVASAGGIAEVVEHERTGLLVEPGNREAMTAAVQRLLTEGQLGEKLRAGAVAARDRFDRDRMVRDMHALCRDAMAA